MPAFALRAVEGPGTLTAALEGFDELMTATDHVEFYWFPHTDVTLLKCNTRVPLEEGLAPLPRWRAVLGRRDPRQRRLRRRRRRGTARCRR